MAAAARAGRRRGSEAVVPMPRYPAEGLPPRRAGPGVAPAKPLRGTSVPPSTNQRRSSNDFGRMQLQGVPAKATDPNKAPPLRPPTPISARGAPPSPSRADPAVPGFDLLPAAAAIGPAPRRSASVPLQARQPAGRPSPRSPSPAVRPAAAALPGPSPRGRLGPRLSAAPGNPRPAGSAATPTGRGNGLGKPGGGGGATPSQQYLDQSYMLSVHIAYGEQLRRERGRSKSSRPSELWVRVSLDVPGAAMHHTRPAPYDGGRVTWEETAPDVLLLLLARYVMLEVHEGHPNGRGTALVRGKLDLQQPEGVLHAVDMSTTSSKQGRVFLRYTRHPVPTATPVLLSGPNLTPKSKRCAKALPAVSPVTPTVSTTPSSDPGPAEDGHPQQEAVPKSRPPPSAPSTPSASSPPADPGPDLALPRLPSDANAAPPPDPGAQTQSSSPLPNAIARAELLSSTHSSEAQRTRPTAEGGARGPQPASPGTRTPRRGAPAPAAPTASAEQAPQPGRPASTSPSPAAPAPTPADLLRRVMPHVSEAEAEAALRRAGQDVAAAIHALLAGAADDGGRGGPGGPRPASASANASGRSTPRAAATQPSGRRPPSSSPAAAPAAEAVARLQQVMPQLSPAEAAHTLQRAGNDIKAAVHLLLNETDPDQSSSSPRPATHSAAATLSPRLPRATNGFAQPSSEPLQRLPRGKDDWQAHTARPVHRTETVPRAAPQNGPADSSSSSSPPPRRPASPPTPDGGGAAPPAELAEAVDRVRRVMPHVTEQQAEDALRLTDHDVKAAVLLLLEAPDVVGGPRPELEASGTLAAPPRKPRPTRQQRLPVSAAFPAHASEELQRAQARMAEQLRQAWAWPAERLGPQCDGPTRPARDPSAPYLPAREAAIVEGKERLVDRLCRLGLEEIVMADDGHCQFRALAHQLCGSADHHEWVRARVVKHLSSNTTYYRAYFGGDAEFAAYLEDMAEDEWGDEVTLRACADAFGVVVHVVMSAATPWYRTWEPTEAPSPARHVVLSYLSPVHYNALMPASPQPPALPPTEPAPPSPLKPTTMPEVDSNPLTAE